jgi:TolA-binding protein
MSEAERTKGTIYFEDRTWQLLKDVSQDLNVHPATKGSRLRRGSAAAVAEAIIWGYEQIHVQLLAAREENRRLRAEVEKVDQVKSQARTMQDRVKRMTEDMQRQLAGMVAELHSNLEVVANMGQAAPVIPLQTPAAVPAPATPTPAPPTAQVAPRPARQTALPVERTHATITAEILALEDYLSIYRGTLKAGKTVMGDKVDKNELKGMIRATEARVIELKEEQAAAADQAAPQVPSPAPQPGQVWIRSEWHTAGFVTAPQMAGRKFRPWAGSEWRTAGIVTNPAHRSTVQKLFGHSIVHFATWGAWLARRWEEQTI